jgi:hypothetical protein
MPYVKWPRGRLRVEVRTQPTLSFTMVLLLPTLLLSKSVGIILKCDKKVVAISGRLEFSFGVLSRAQQVHCSRAGSATTAMYAREASQSKVASRNRFDVSSFRRQRKRHWNGSYRPAASSGALIRQAEMRFLLGMRPQEVLEAIIASSSHHHRIVPSSIHRCLPSLQAMQANSLHHHLIPHISYPPHLTHPLTRSHTPSLPPKKQDTILYIQCRECL